MASEAEQEREFAQTCTIWVRGEGLDPDAVTKRLGIEPTGTHRKGDVRRSPAGTEIVARIGIWKYRVQADSPDFGPAIQQLLSAFDGVDIDLTTLPGVDDAVFDIYGTSDRTESFDSAYLAVTPVQLKRLADLGLMLEVSVSFFDPPGGERKASADSPP